MTTTLFRRAFVILLVFGCLPLRAQVPDDTLPDAFLREAPPDNARELSYTYVSIPESEGSDSAPISTYTPVVRRAYVDGLLEREEWYAGGNAAVAAHEFTYSPSSSGLPGEIRSRFRPDLEAPAVLLPSRRLFSYSSGRLTSLEGRSASGSRLYTRRLSYNGQGNAVREEYLLSGSAAVLTIDRTYDQAGRLVSARYSEGATLLFEEAYAYRSDGRIRQLRGNEAAGGTRSGTVTRSLEVSPSGTVTLYGSYPANAADLLQRRARELEARLFASFTDRRLGEMELLSIFGASAPLQLSAVSYRILRGLDELADRLDGRFTPLLDLYGVGPDEGSARLDLAHRDQIRFGQGLFETSLAASGAVVDLERFARGAIIDELRLALTDLGVSRAVVQVGGLHYIAGLQAEARPFTLEVAPPQQSAGSSSLFEVDAVNASVVTAYRRGAAEVEDAENPPLVSATVIATEGVLVDVLSRVLVEQQLDEALRILSLFPEVRATALVTADYQVVATGYLRGTLVPTDPRLRILDRQVPDPPDFFLGLDDPEFLLAPSDEEEEEEPVPQEERVWETTSVDRRGNWTARTEYRVVSGAGATTKTPVAKVLRTIIY